ncbi:MAG: hypothetical protein KKG59_06150, partial [Nanoarchaeota archaeon]|nr:hypothetical protein [Nanoarchaeota archaeon]
MKEKRNVMRYSAVLIALLMLSTMVAGATLSSEKVDTNINNGDVLKIGAPGNHLELQERIGDVVPRVGAAQLDILEGGLIHVMMGDSRYNQRLFFTGNDIVSARTVFGENRDDEVGDYLKFDGNEYFFDYQLTFRPMLRGHVDNDNHISQFEGEYLNILGKEYMILIATHSPHESWMKMRLLDSEIRDVLHEGETKTYTVGGADYEITPVFIGEMGDQECAKFSVNGEISDTICELGTDFMQQGMPLSVRAILINEHDAIVEFHFGGTVLDIKDMYTDDEYYEGVEINVDHMNNARLKFTAQRDGDVFALHKINYKVKADNVAGGTDIYVKEGDVLSDYMEDPQTLLGGTWDFNYDGLTNRRISDIRIDGHGDDEYNLEFTNENGQEYDIGYVSTDDQFMYGNGQDF